MFLKTDPRSKLASGGAPKVAPATAYAAADYLKFYETEPQEVSATGRSWYGRGQNFVVIYTEAKEGWTFERKNQIDEYVVMLPEGGAGATFTAADGEKSAPAASLIIMPPGDSKVRMNGDGRIVIMVTSKATDLTAKCANASSYDERQPNIADFQPWPEPPAGYKIRVYPINVPKQEGRFGRIWRCTTFMVNWVEPRIGPRAITARSPHYHDDFEQCSLLLDGGYTHHLRWPWTSDGGIWRDDNHEYCGSPSITIIPPRVIHTSSAMAPGKNELVDIFSPPRADLSGKPGWVLNEDEYPLPGDM